MATGTGAPASLVARCVAEEADRRMETLPADFPHALWRLKYARAGGGPVEVVVRVQPDRAAMRAELVAALTAMDRRFGVWTR